MKARAPGKLVLSGSYSVLYGAPALVTAAGRFAIADSERAPVHVAEEVEVAVRRGAIPSPCFVDASELRAYEADGTSRKLGLGSSAAILLSTLVAHRGAPSDDAAREALFHEGLAIHREAQGGGSGVDVAASTFGGTLTFYSDSTAPKVARHRLPVGLVVRVFAARTSAVTAGFVARVKALGASDPTSFDPLMQTASTGAREAVGAATVSTFLDALTRQRDALARVGDLANVPIVTSEVRELAKLAASEQSFFGPSGAGGGDVAFFAASSEPSAAFVEQARNHGYDLLDCSIDAPGVSVL
jgi:phosphomevalonate kinase